MKRLLAYLFLVLGLGLVVSVNVVAAEKDIAQKMFSENYKEKDSVIEICGVGQGYNIFLRTYKNLAEYKKSKTFKNICSKFVDKSTNKSLHYHLFSFISEKPRGFCTCERDVTIKFYKTLIEKHGIPNEFNKTQIAKKEPATKQKIEAVKIKETVKESKKISYKYESNKCTPVKSIVSFKKVICISKRDVEDLLKGYSLNPFQSFTKDSYINGRYKQISKLSEIYPEKLYQIVNKGCASWQCTKNRAGAKVYELFIKKTERWHTKYPGDIIYAMSWFEILYLGKINESKKIINRYLESSSDDYFQAKGDKKKLKSLIKMNKGRLKMREAIGLKRDDNLSKVFQTQWLLGDYLNKDKIVVKKNKIDPAIMKRKILMMNYKTAVKKYKEKVLEVK